MDSSTNNKEENHKVINHNIKEENHNTIKVVNPNIIKEANQIIKEENHNIKVDSIITEETIIIIEEVTNKVEIETLIIIKADNIMEVIKTSTIITEEVSTREEMENHSTKEIDLIVFISLQFFIYKNCRLILFFTSNYYCV